MLSSTKCSTLKRLWNCTKFNRAMILIHSYSDFWNFLIYIYIYIHIYIYIYIFIIHSALFWIKSSSGKLFQCKNNTWAYFFALDSVSLMVDIDWKWSHLFIKGLAIEEEPKSNPLPSTESIPKHKSSPFAIPTGRLESDVIRD